MTNRPTDSRYVLLALLALGAREVANGQWRDADEVFAELDRTDRLSGEECGPLLDQAQQQPEGKVSSAPDRLSTTKYWVRPGWMPLVLEARQKLLALDVQVLEAREKLGTLRVHVAAIHTRRPEVRDIVETAAALASKTCDICGASGRRSDGAPWRVRCLSHANVIDGGL